MSISDCTDYTLVSIDKKPRSAQSIRNSYLRKFEYGDNILLGLAIDKGSKYVRQYYNNINLRKRKL